MSSQKKIVVVGAKHRSLINFRGELLKKMVFKYDVVALASGATLTEIKNIESLGARYLDLDINRNGLNVFQDSKTFWQLLSLFKHEKPDVILAYTIKPIIWGGLASRLIPECRFYALVTGLGFAFQKGNRLKNILVRLVAFLYTKALKKSEKVIFQNPDNRQVFIDLGIINEEKAFVVNGSGVDLSHFSKEPLTSIPKFLLIARLLGDKGIKEYIAAANIVRLKYPKAIFQLLGAEDASPDGISLQEFEYLNSKKVIDYLGSTDDVRPFLKESNIFVLPSYHEGLPRTVLEAMAIGRPIITTNVPGCKETVVDGVNGFLVEKQNSAQLAEKMIWFIENYDKWNDMAHSSRIMAEEKFDVKKINSELLKIMD
ncbi:glycosyltransferase family 4 protein, partial [Shewanella sp. KT0246]|uniref:glycosyltransferase family 4 protein n=1 Tax=Shewanella sp. KT0246 TaxID=2815912 RepID=UPI001C7DCB34